MSWDDDDDFYAAIDWEAQVQQARARQQPRAAAPPAPAWQQQHPPPQQHPQRQPQQPMHPPQHPQQPVNPQHQHHHHHQHQHQQQQPVHPHQQQPVPARQQQQGGPTAGQPAADGGVRSLFSAGPTWTGQQPGRQAAPGQQQGYPPVRQQGPAPPYPQHMHQHQHQQRPMQQGTGQWQQAPQQYGVARPPQQAYAAMPHPQQQQQHLQSRGGPAPPQQPHDGQQRWEQPRQPYGQQQPLQQPGGPQLYGGMAPGGMVPQQRPSGGGGPGGAGSGPMGAGSGHTGVASGHIGAGSGPAGAAAGHGSGMASGGTNPLLYINLELGKDQLIEVKCAYHEAVSAALKRLPGGQWDPKSRHWRFPLSQHDRIVQALQSLTGVRVRLEPLHPLVSAVLRAASANPDDSDRYCTLPSSLEQQLMPFQRDGVKFALRHGGRALIGDEMGLGKTVQAIAVAAAYRDEWPLLVIAPSSLREAWADALHRWLNLTEDKMHIVHSGKDAANVPKNIQVLILSYNFCTKMDLSKKFNVVILDESHYIKDGQAQRTKATVPLVKEARRAILLSGTPALNKPKELFQQLSALVPTARLKMKDFGERYCQGSYFDKYGGASNLAELNAVLKSSVMVRRLKRDVLTQLPSKRRQQVILGLDADAKKQLAGLQRQLEVARQLMGEEARKSAASGGAVSGSAMGQNAVITELYKKTAEVKAKAVQEYVQLLLDNGQKFLVFATCNRHKGCQHIRIDGSTPPASRQSLVNKFQENQDVRVAILSIKAAGTGLTLTAASTVVFAEMTWTPGEIIQAEDRAHRIGQASSVNVYFLHAKGSSDDLIWNSLEKKLDTVGEAIDGQGQALHARRTEAPERGQMGLQQFMTQSRPGEAALRQHWQVGGAGAGAAAATAGAGGKCPPAGGSGTGKSPGKTTQGTLLNFFGSGNRQPPAQQQQQQACPGAQQQQQAPPPPPHHQQQQQQQQQQQAGPALPYHWDQQGPFAPVPAPGPQQRQPCPQPLHGPSGMANLQHMQPGPGKPGGVLSAQQQQQAPPPQQPLAGMKRPFGS